MDAISMSLDDIIKTKKVLLKPTKKASLLAKKKKKGNDEATSPVKSIKLKTKRLGSQSPKVIVDARNKIIQRNRSKITDARDKLAQITKQSGDVRLKLMRKMELSRKTPIGRGLGSDAFVLDTRRHMKKRPSPYLDDHLVAPVGYRSRRPAPAVHRMDYDMDLDDDELDFVPATVALRRTVQNEMAFSSKMPPLPTFQRSVAIHSDYRPQSPPISYAHHQRVIRNAASPPPSLPMVSNWQSDPFDCYEVPINRPMDVSEPKNLQRQIRSTPADMMPTKGILRYSSRDSRNSPPPPPMMAQQQRSSSSTGGYSSSAHHVQHHPHHQQRQHQHYNLDHLDDTHLSYEMRHRLERAPDVNTSMGIFSNPYTVVNKPIQAPPTTTTSGYRIVVSNLHNTVSQSDIRELFEDIGELVEARLVRPGVAEVIFRTMKDAELAVDTYHNRQLDGQPMKCLLVNPRASSKPTAPAIKTARR